MLILVYTCQNTTLSEITCHGHQVKSVIFSIVVSKIYENHCEQKTTINYLQ